MHRGCCKRTELTLVGLTGLEIEQFIDGFAYTSYCSSWNYSLHINFAIFARLAESAKFKCNEIGIIILDIILFF